MSILLGGFNSGLAAVIALAVFLVVMYVASVVVEGPRRATDRLVTHLVYAAFLAALLPLLSVIWTTLAGGLRRFDGQFFGYSMRNVLGEGGGRAEAGKIAVAEMIEFHAESFICREELVAQRVRKTNAELAETDERRLVLALEPLKQRFRQRVAWRAHLSIPRPRFCL